MENQERDMFAEALVFLKRKRLEQCGYVAEGLRAVRTENAPEEDESA